MKDNPGEIYISFNILVLIVLDYFNLYITV